MYPLKLHKNLSSEKWQSFSPGQQILMIAGEFSRAESWIERSDPNAVRRCDERAFELLDLTAEDPRWSRGLRELLRFRELLAGRYAAGSMDITENREFLRALLSLNTEAANTMRYAFQEGDKS
jgi:hypothetical protein